MKCDELKPIRQGSVELGEYWVYDADEVDAAIDELNAKLAEKESDYKSALKYVSHWHDNYCELQKVVDRLQTKSECKEDKIRILKRALWMARKAHAVAMVAYWDSHYRDNPNAVYRNRTVDWLRNRWLLILDAIIKKEKEYK